jgi:hypothetical protein
MFYIDDRVYIIPIDERGTIKNIRRDSEGGLIYDVLLDGGFGHIHLCRESELAL